MKLDFELMDVYSGLSITCFSDSLLLQIAIS